MNTIARAGQPADAVLLPVLQDRDGWRVMYSASAVSVLVAGLLALLLKPDRAKVEPAVAQMLAREAAA